VKTPAKHDDAFGKAQDNTAIAEYTLHISAAFTKNITQKLFDTRLGKYTVSTLAFRKLMTKLIIYFIQKIKRD
jgi:hypothetical protein